MSWQEAAQDALVMLCTAPDNDTAHRIAHALVDAQDAACVNVLPQVRSIYRWKGTVCDDPEVLMLIKTTRSRAAAAAEHVARLHPYENPEVIGLPVASGLAPYLAWLLAETGTGATRDP